MNLNTMSQMYQNTTGQALGFKLKSRTTGRIFEATHKTGAGRYLIVDVGGTKEALVDGDADRYEFADPRFDANAGQRQALSTKLAELMNKEGELEALIDSKENELEDLRTEIEDVELEIDNLG